MVYIYCILYESKCNLELFLFSLLLNKFFSLRTRLCQFFIFLFQYLLKMFQAKCSTHCTITVQADLIDVLLICVYNIYTCINVVFAHLWWLFIVFDESSFLYIFKIYSVFKEEACVMVRYKKCNGESLLQILDRVLKFFCKRLIFLWLDLDFNTQY